MPRVDFSKAETYDEMYSPRLYRREFMGEIAPDQAWRLFDYVKPQPNEKIALVGCGFGWLAEAWLTRDPALQLFCVDNSPWIQANKSEHAVLPITATVPAGMDFIITEDVMACLYDDECVELAAQLRALAPVLHWISQGVPLHDDPTKFAGFPHYNWKSIADWRALLAPDDVLERNVL